MLKRFLFTTRIGLWFLILFERVTGLALVDTQWLGRQTSGMPTTEGG